MIIGKGGSVPGVEEVLFNGVACWLLENDSLALWLSMDFGPRVLGLSYQGSDNLLAWLPDATLPGAGGKPYWLRGGHRLWVAPERPETTFIPDDLPLNGRVIEKGFEVIQDVDSSSGIQKSWVVKLEPGAPKVILDHCLSNRGEEVVKVAPWAITMLRPGGVGLLPFQQHPDDAHGLWPNRQLVIWPYTDLESDHLQLTNQGVFVSAEMQEGALKVGAPNPLGWIAYRHKELLFVKKSRYLDGEIYVDRGASHQIYCNPTVIELETLGPIQSMEPGQALKHQETWMIYSDGNWPEEIRTIFTDQ
jgi:hypothetical protein